MNMNTKLLIGALSLLAVAATPAAASAKTHYVRTHHSRIVRVAPPAYGWQGAYRAYPSWEGAYAYQPSRDPVSDHAEYDGFQRDRQMVGIGY